MLDALGAGLTTIPLMVERIYVGIVPGLVGHASRNVQAHLFKLEDEGTVEQRGDQLGADDLMVPPHASSQCSTARAAPP